MHRFGVGKNIPALFYVQFSPQCCLSSLVHIKNMPYFEIIWLSGFIAKSWLKHRYLSSLLCVTKNQHHRDANCNFMENCVGTMIICDKINGVAGISNLVHPLPLFVLCLPTTLFVDSRWLNYVMRIMSMFVVLLSKSIYLN